MKKLPRGLRKHIRQEKARIRREYSNEGDREKNIRILYSSIRR